jgi:hypothetical protein
MVKLNKQCNFPWLMANVLARGTGEARGSGCAGLGNSQAGALCLEGRCKLALGVLRVAPMTAPPFADVSGLSSLCAAADKPYGQAGTTWLETWNGGASGGRLHEAARATATGALLTSGYLARGRHGAPTALHRKRRQRTSALCTSSCGTGIKVGVVGLVEEEWLETLGAVNVADMVYVDFIQCGRKAARELRVRHGTWRAGWEAAGVCAGKGP